MQPQIHTFYKACTDKHLESTFVFLPSVYQNFQYFLYEQESYSKLLNQNSVTSHNHNELCSLYKIQSLNITLVQGLGKVFFFFFFSICLDVPHLTNEHRTQDCIAS